MFGSPSGLELQLVCTDKTPTRAMLDVWPALPLCIRSEGKYSKNQDNIIAALERSDRVVGIELVDVGVTDLSALFPAMKMPFPELSYLDIAAGEVVLRDERADIPDLFLGGSAPSLEHLSLKGVPFSRLPILLLSCTYLVRLYLEDVPCTEWIQSPKLVLMPSENWCRADPTDSDIIRDELSSQKCSDNPISRPNLGRIQMGSEFI